MLPGASGEWDHNLNVPGGIIYHNNTYHMWYTGGIITDSLGIGHATSLDGITWTKDINNPVLSKGKVGEWDESHVFSGSVILIDSIFHMWYTGHRGDDFSANFQIGHATSPDGVTWTKDTNNPVLSMGPSGTWDDTWIAGGSVVYDGNEYHMWYNGHSTGAGGLRLGHAISPDAITWTKDTNNPVLIPSGKWDSPRVEMPSVVFDGMNYHMWYAGGEYFSWQIGYATSENGSTWTKYPNNPVLREGSAGSWDAKSVAWSSVIDSAGAKYKMWYAGSSTSLKASIGYAESSPFVNIPDTAFLYAILDEGVDTNGDSLISYGEAGLVTTLDVSERGISDMTGIEAFVNLDTLYCHGNELTVLDLSNNPALTYLACDGNPLTSLDVSGCNALTRLDVSDNTDLEELYLFNDPFLYQVCVWESFPAGVTVSTEDSPNVFFTTECDTSKFSTIQFIRFGSTGDPLNGLTVTWQNLGISDSIAWGFTSSLEEGKFEVIKRVNVFGKNVYDYTFPALSPETTIHYTLFDSKESIWTSERTYLTASDASDNSYSFTTFGDSRTYPEEWRKIAEATLETDFTLFLGDIIADGAVESDWNDWFEYGKTFVTRELVYHSIGNHDEDNSVSGFDTYSDMFTLPGNELYYSFTYGNALFICLNSEDPGNAEQNSWLHSTLEANKDQTWKFVFFHRPFYTSPSHVGEMDAYFDTWWKESDDYGVDMIFNGHTHNYQRTKPINRLVSTTSPVDLYGSFEGMGRCQVVSGAAGAPMKNPADPGLWWLAKSESKLHFCNIYIDGDALTFKAIDENQVVFDDLVLDKTTGINDFRSTSNIRVYPNPANDLLTIETDDPGQHTIEITSLNGQLLYSTLIEGPTHQIDLSTFQRGLYFITIRSRDFVKTEKIIKQ
jgi:predicted GH43/DUF377 family glycosyl hydrolase